MIMLEIVVNLTVKTKLLKIEIHEIKILLLPFFFLAAIPIPKQALPARPDTKASLWSMETLRRLSSNTSTAIFAVLFLASLLALAVVVIYFTRKRKMEDSQHLITSAWDN